MQPHTYRYVAPRSSKAVMLSSGSATNDASTAEYLCSGRPHAGDGVNSVLVIVIHVLAWCWQDVGRCQ